MTAEDDFFFPHTVSVRNLLPGGGRARAYGDARDVRCEVKDEQRLIRGNDGAQVVSSSQVTVGLDEHIPLGSLVTVWPGTAAAREAEVLAVGRNENGVDLDSFNVLSLK